MKIKKILIAAVFAMFSSANVNAFEMPSFDGFSLGVSGTGWQFDGAKGSETTSSETREEDLAAILGSVFVEYNLGPVSIGVDFIPYTLATETSENNQISPALTDSGRTLIQADIKEHVTGYVVVPVVDTGLFIRAAMMQANFVTNETMATGSQYGNADLEGFAVSVGYQFDTDAGVSIRAEAGHAEYDDINITGTGGDGTANTVTATGLDGPTAKLSIVKSF